MKKPQFTLVLFLVTALCFAQQENDRVQISDGGTWYNGTILKVSSEEGLYYVNFDKWNGGRKEWVTPDRLQGFNQVPLEAPLTQFKVDDKVEVLNGKVWEPAIILEVGEDRYRVKFNDSILGEKWVSETEISWP